MPIKFVNATELKPGSYCLIDDAPCVVRTVDISKTGKHGASKCRIEAIGIIDEKKRVLVKPGHEKFAVPMIDKKKGQILTIGQSSATLMDTESFETLEVPFLQEIKEELKEGIQVEYWDIEGLKIIKRTIISQSA
jgi:translation initiation factor 5A